MAEKKATTKKAAETKEAKAPAAKKATATKKAAVKAPGASAMVNVLRPQCVEHVLLHSKHFRKA